MEQIGLGWDVRPQQLKKAMCLEDEGDAANLSVMLGKGFGCISQRWLGSFTCL